MPSSLPRWPARSDRSWDGLFQPFPCSPAATAFPFFVQGRRPHWSFRGLLDVHSRYGLPVRRTASRYVCLEGSDGFVASTAAPIATGWSDPFARRDSHPLKIPDFSRRTQSLTPQVCRFGPPRFANSLSLQSTARSARGCPSGSNIGQPARRYQSARRDSAAPASGCRPPGN